MKANRESFIKDVTHRGIRTVANFCLDQGARRQKSSLYGGYMGLFCQRAVRRWAKTGAVRLSLQMAFLVCMLFWVPGAVGQEIEVYDTAAVGDGVAVAAQPQEGRRMADNISDDDEIFIEDLDEEEPRLFLPSSSKVVSPPPVTVFSPKIPDYAQPRIFTGKTSRVQNRRTQTVSSKRGAAHTVSKSDILKQRVKMASEESSNVPPIFLDKDGQPIKLPSTMLEDAPAKEFLMKRLNDEDINVLIDPSIDCKVSMRLVGVSLWIAVERILDACDLGWRIKGNIFQVERLENINKTRGLRQMVIRPYYLKYLRAEEVKKFILGETTVKTTDIQGYSLQGDDEEEKAQQTEGLLSPGTEFESPSVVADEATNCIIIKDEPENVERIVKLIEAMDHPRPQIKIQTWIVETNRTTAREIGLRWSGSFRVGDSDVFSASRDLTDGSASQFNYPLKGIERGIIPPQQTDTSSVIPLQPYEHEVENAPYLGRLYSLGVAASGSSGAIVAELQTLESTGALRILSRPEMVLQDNREATITQGQDIYVPSVTADRIGTNEINAKLEVIVKPHITPDGSIIIDIKLKDRWLPEQPSTDRGVVVNEKGIETRLMVRDGQTIVLGGIRHARKERNADGVPYLKDIPLLGNLFKYSSDKDELEELLLIMRPVILDEEFQG